MFPKIDYLEYDNIKFNFKNLLEDFFKCELTQLHKKFNIEKKSYDICGTDNISIVEDAYKNVITSNNFKTVWYSFIQTVVKPYFNNEKILIQKLPSINIIPSNCEVKYVDKTVDGYNLHLESDEPFCHPLFEQNFWMPMTHTDELNDLYFVDWPNQGNDFEDNNEKIRVDAKLNQIFRFGNDVVHGNKVKNKSKNTRISIDFKALSLSDYDQKLISNKKIIKRGKEYSQKDWYSTKYYYMEI